MLEKKCGGGGEVLCSVFRANKVTYILLQKKLKLILSLTRVSQYRKSCEILKTLKS
jgi:hypothetical protein